MKQVLISGAIRSAIYNILATIYFWYTGAFEEGKYGVFTFILIYLGLEVIAFSGAFFRAVRHKQEKGRD